LTENGGKTGTPTPLKCFVYSKYAWTVHQSSTQDTGDLKIIIFPTGKIVLGG